MAARTWTPDEDTLIRDGYANGVPVRQLAKQLGCGIGTVSKRAATIGATTTARSQVAAAVEAKQLDAKAKRATLKANLLDDAARLRAQLWEPAEYVDHGGKEFVEVRWTMPTPVYTDQLKLMQATSTAIGSYERLEKLDADTGLTDAVGMLDKIAAEIARVAETC